MITAAGAHSSLDRCFSTQSHYLSDAGAPSASGAGAASDHASPAFLVNSHRTALPAVHAAGAPVVMLHAAPIPGVRIRVPKVSSGLDKRRARKLACHVSACRCQR